MRAFKRVLGTPLMHETRQILKERVTFVEIIARFLSHIKTRAEGQAGVTFEHVLSGRPVVFHGANDAREAQAEADLRACYLAAGFKEVDFLPEPAAAALANGAVIQSGETGLIVDIGGGTSDFSVRCSAPPTRACPCWPAMACGSAARILIARSASSGLCPCLGRDQSFAR